MEFAKEVYRFLSPWFVIVSEIQRGGYGQYGRKWESPEGGLWFTEVINIQKRQAFSLFLALSVVRALKSFGVRDVFVKWPNDIYLKRKKLAGILTKIRNETVFAGIGINVENDVPVSVENIAVTLKETASVGKIELLNAILEAQAAMLEEYEEFGFKPFITEYENVLIFRNKLVTVQSREVFQGVAFGVNEFGNLILETESGRVIVQSGTIIEF